MEKSKTKQAGKMAHLNINIKLENCNFKMKVLMEWNETESKREPAVGTKNIHLIFLGDVMMTFA